MSDILNPSYSYKSFVLDPKTWLTVLAAVFAAGSAVAVVERSRTDHDNVTMQIKTEQSLQLKSNDEQLRNLVREAERNRLVHEETLAVLRIMCIRNANNDMARTACIGNPR